MVSAARTLIPVLWTLASWSILFAQPLPRFERIFHRHLPGATEIRFRFTNRVAYTYGRQGDTLWVRTHAQGTAARYPDLNSTRIRGIETVPFENGGFEIRLLLGGEVDPTFILRGRDLDLRLEDPSLPNATAVQRVSDMDLPRMEGPLGDLLPLQVRHITLDPGHGGHDTGAVAGTLQEKVLTLDIALKLEVLLTGQTPVSVSLTRRGDYYVDLSERVLVANEHRADLFVSLHCNASQRHTGHGTEVFFFSEKPSDRQAELVALRENGPAVTVLPQNRVIDLDEILLRAERRVFWRESKRLAEQFQQGLVQAFQTRSRGVKSANFAVLREARMPALLIEMAFLDNDQDALRLQKETFRWQIARGMAAVVQRLIEPFEGGPLEKCPSR